MTTTHAEMRHIMALYYGYGRNDAAKAGDPYVDPLNFAEHYLSLFEEFALGNASSMPSVQDAWRRYKLMTLHPSNRRNA